jgi:hypothetical protein
MKGTPTIGKAKSLKEKRELAAELGTSRTSSSPAFRSSLLPVFRVCYIHRASRLHHRGAQKIADCIDDVQEFEAKRGVSDAPEERASRSKDTGRRPSGDETEEDAEEEYQVRGKPQVSLLS